MGIAHSTYTEGRLGGGTLGYQSRTSMKKIILPIVFSIIFLNNGTSADATPDAAIWEKAIFLGTSENYYYCLVIKRDWPNSYYEYSDELLVRKYDTKGNAVENIKLREISYFKDPPDHAQKWKLKDEHKPSMDLADFLIKNKVLLHFPEDIITVRNTAGKLIPIRFSLNNNKLLILTGDYKEVLADRNYIEMFFSNDIRYLFEEPHYVSLVEYYSDDVNIYFVISVGDFYCGECDAQQSIVVVPYQKLTQAVDSFNIKSDK